MQYDLHVYHWEMHGEALVTDYRRKRALKAASR